jgi:drug/metabolite transporter (DMT)-like permease
MFYLPIIGAIALASATIMQRLVIKRKNIDIKLYNSAEFLAIVLASLPFIYFFWKVDPQALELKNMIIFFLVVLFSIIANMFTFYSMKWEKVSNLEPAKVLEPLFVILLAIIFSFVISSELYERNFHVIIPAILAGLALIFSHIKKHHLNFNKYFIAAIIGSFFFALELVLSKLILDFYSPLSFYFIRCLFIFIIGLIIFKPHLEKLDKKLRLKMLLVGFVWIIYRLAVYYGYQKLGVVSTTLMLMLGPIFIYLFAHKFLKEKLEWRNIIASIVIIASIGYVLLS